MDIYTQADLERAILSDIVPPLLEELSKEAVKIMQEAISQDAEISTSSLQDSMTYSLSADKQQSTVYIDYNFCQFAYGYAPTFDEKGKLVEWGNFRNTFSGGGGKAGSGKWNGEFISFQLADWLEDGGRGHIGNQPIAANHWFSTKAVPKIRAMIPRVTRSFLSKRGLI